MRNHFHLLLETPQPNLVAGMKWFLGTYTSRYNRRHKEYGHLFSGRYKALLVEGNGNGYLKTAGDYVHLNPARAGVLAPEQPLASFPWSSYPGYLAPPAQRPAWLRVDRLLGEWGIPKDSVAGREVFAARMEMRRREDWEEEFLALERAWCLGSEEFRQELLAQVKELPGPSHFGEVVQEAVEVRAERLVLTALAKAGWTEADLKRRRKGDHRKIEIARELRSKTTMPLAWIAQRLSMGTRGHLAGLLQHTPATPDTSPEQALLKL